MKQPTPWKIFSRVPNAEAIVAELKLIPSHWSLTPLQDKSPRRTNWQTEEFIPHHTIADLIEHGEKKTSFKGNPYTAYYSGFGLRTGAPSGGLLAIDVDGESALPLLQAISTGDIPKTVCWTSGKEGRMQFLFVLPPEVQEQLKDFNRAVLTSWGDLQTLHDENGRPTELLEFRYNRSQSCLPPSRHPTTGGYYWINSPLNTTVAIAPQWLCDLLIELATFERKKSQTQQEAARQRTQQLLQRRTQYHCSGVTNNVIDFYSFEVMPRLTAEQIFCWPGHNFRSYGKTLKGNPPWRASASGTSFHVWWDGHHWAWQDKATGEGGGAIQYRFKLRGGSGTPKGSDFVEIVRELAADVGLSLPKPQSLPKLGIEPDASEYASYLHWEAHSEAIDELSAENSLHHEVNRWVKSQLKRLKRLANWKKREQGAGSSSQGSYSPVPTPYSLLPTLKFDPNKPLPTPFEIAAAGLLPPKIVFEKGQRLQVLAAAKAAGWQFTLDISFTGSGKSHDAGLLLFDQRKAEGRGQEAGGIYPDAKQKAGVERQEAGGICTVELSYKFFPTATCLLPPASGCLLATKGSRGFKPPLNSSSVAPVQEGSQSPPVASASRRVRNLLPAASCLLPSQPSSTGKIWYWDSNHRNCSTDIVAQNYEDMVIRHDGLYGVEGRTNASGEPHLKYARTPQEKELAIEPSNCFQADTFIRLREKGYQMEASGQNPICQGCPFNWNCAKSSGDGYGYRFLRKEVMQKPLIRADLRSAPSPLTVGATSKHAYDYSHDTCFVEEASRSISGAITLTAFDKDLAQLWWQLEQGDEGIFQELAHIRGFLYLAMKGEIESFDRKYGASHTGLMSDELCPKPPENIKELIERLKALTTKKLSEVFTVPDSVKGLGGKWRLAGNRVRSLFQQQARIETNDNIDNLPPNILIHVLEIWAGLKPGAIRVNRGQVSVTIIDERPGEVLRAHKHVHLLDATADKKQLAAHLRVHPHQILEIEQERPPINNLTVHNVNLEGMGSNQFSDTCKARQIACLKFLKEQWGDDLAVIALKDSDHIDNDGHWFHDNRGTNAFVGKKAIAAFAKPMANLGALEDEYLTLHGTLDGFEEYYSSTIRAEIEQLIGRQRPHLDPDNQYVIYIFSKGLDLDYLENYGITLKNLDAFEIVPEAGTDSEILLWKLQQGYKYLISQGEKIIQKSLAPTAGVTQGRLSQFAKKFGGWKGLKKILASLLESYRDANNLEPSSSDELALAHDGLQPLLDREPSEAVPFVATLVRVLGLHFAVRVLQCLPLPSQAQLLGLFLAHFNEPMWHDLAQLNEPEPL